MAESHIGLVEFKSTSPRGGPGPTIVEVDPDGSVDGGVVLRVTRGTVVLPGANVLERGQLVLGKDGSPGVLDVRDEAGERCVVISGGTVQLGGDGSSGELVVRDSGGDVTLRLDGDSGAVHIGGWSLSVPDFVLADDYEVPSPSELLSRIRKEGHLPGVPSSQEIESEGLELGAFAMKLLEKVEELTLMVINQHAEVQELAQRVVACERLTR